MKKCFFELRIVATIVACLAVSVALVGCGKENGDDVGDGPLVTEIIYDDGWRETFEYDSQNRITKMTSYDDGKVRSFETLSYNSEGDLISLTRNYPDYPDNDETMTFTKNGNTITMNRSFADEVFELNAQGLLGKTTREASSEKLIITYQYQEKNLTTVTEDVEANWNGENYKRFTTITFTYDDKKGAFYHCKTPQWYLVRMYVHYFGIQNNPKTSIFTRDGSVRATETFEYTYNDEGFPITITMKYEDDDDNVDTTNITLKYNN